ncbi:putative multidrug resistance-associated protein 5, partial [Apostichopus japonicus]
SIDFGKKRLRRETRRGSLGKTAIRFVATRQTLSVLFLMLFIMCAFINSAILIQKLLQWVESPVVEVWYGLLLVGMIWVLNMGRIAGDSLFWNFSNVTATRLRSGTLAACFNRLARLRSLQQHSVGEIVNVCANDSQRLYDVCIIGNFVISSLVMFMAGCVAALIIIGPGALLGTLSTFLVLLPMQMVIGKATSVLRQKSIKKFDERVQKMNEILTFIKFIKVYAWEKPFSKKIEDIRVRERVFLKKAGIMQSFSISMMPIAPNVATVLSILLHIAFGNGLTISEAFTLVAVLNTLRIVVGPTPWAIRSIAETVIALRRLRVILVLDTVEPLDRMPDDGRHAVIIEDATFAWSKVASNTEEDKTAAKEAEREVGEDGKIDDKPAGTKDGVKDGTEKSPSTVSITQLASQGSQIELDEMVPALFNLNFKLYKGQLTGVCGMVGSGKSSLLSAILGQMHKLRGVCKVNGNFAYASQEAWIFNATLKDNILFGKDFDEEKYTSVIEACCLTQDFEILPSGDKTEIGERGINLSGGQKQRVSLARALYADHDIYLLDDPLSAVDAHVGQHIFEQCLKTALKDKTVLFVTHQLQYLKDCDSIIVITKGKISEEGRHEELMKANGVYTKLIQTHHSKPDVQRDEEETGEDIEWSEGGGGMSPQRSLSRGMSTRSTASVSTVASIHSEKEEDRNLNGGRLTEEEGKEEGGVSWRTYHGFIKAMGGYFIAIPALLSYVLTMAIVTFNNWWLSYWLNQGNGNQTINESGNRIPQGSIADNPDLSFYMFIYGISLVVIIIFSAFKSVIFMTVMLKASSNLHDTLLYKIFRSPMSFFDKTPTGRILNRFSKDMDELDVLLPINFELALQVFLMVAFAVLTIIIVFPWFLIALLPVGIIFAAILKFYRKGVHDLKRLENIARSPWFSHISSTTLGLTTIHAYEKTDEFVTKFIELLDANAYPLMLFRISGRWAGMRLELLVVLISTLTNLMAVITHGTLSPALVGLAISYTTQLNGMFQLMMAMFAEAEARFTSAERILSYIKDLIPEAPQEIKETEPEQSWPKDGAIKFSDYSMRYRENLPLVLKGINFSVKAGEKIGIVGRTGSGKSSLGVSLFRLVEKSSGEINIDGVNTSKVGLHALRSKLSIIPQDPVLFIGTVRYNLDPFENHNDEELWSALERAHMKNKVSSLPEKLQSLVSEGGDNFSVGERQLICIARALLRHSKILILDEATAAIDTETDSLIQGTIRQAFGQCTLLTIAHRLNTILDADKILVMSDGNVAEFDTPSALLSKKDSVFAGMVAAAEQQHKNSLD